MSDEAPARKGPGLVVVVVSIAAAAGAYFTARHLAGTPEDTGGGGAGPAPQPTSMPARIIAAARTLAPTAYGSPQWTDIMGAPEWAPGKWAYYEDNYGTTCGVFAAKVLEDAGADPSYINRAPPGGRGFVNGMHIAFIERAAIAQGTKIEDADLQPGDLYHATHDNPPGEHVGIVVERNGDQLLTADGGQTDSAGHQCSELISRKLDGSTLTRTDGIPSGPMKVTWRVHFSG